MTSPASTRRGPVDQLFDVLSDARRRTVLCCLRDRRRPMAFEELTETISEREAGERVGSSVEHVAASLHHAHLPKLHQAGLIEWTTEGSVALDESVTDDDLVFELLRRGEFLDSDLR